MSHNSQGKRLFDEYSTKGIGLQNSNKHQGLGFLSGYLVMKTCINSKLRITSALKRGFLQCKNARFFFCMIY